MFAVDHAATALLLKRRYPTMPVTPLLLSVQAMELAWVALNYAGIERTTVDSPLRSVADIHLASMAWSHSLATGLGAAAAAWLLLERGFGRRVWGRAVGLGVVSHLVLDLATHGSDIAVWPGAAWKLGLGLYDHAPLVAFFVELVYGLVCWRVYRGGLALLAVVTLGNVANLSSFSPAIPGPEAYLAGRPMLFVTVILMQIVVTLVLVGVFARRGAVVRPAACPEGLPGQRRRAGAALRGNPAGERTASLEPPNIVATTVGTPLAVLPTVTSPQLVTEVRRNRGAAHGGSQRSRPEGGV
jgi:hypothetical protein